MHAEDGMASYYGGENKKSAFGKKLSSNKLEAAHRTLALGSRVKVTSLKTGKSVIVTIVDRGPYAKKRIIDLNKLAARRIGLDKLGITKVRVEIQG